PEALPTHTLPTHFLHDALPISVAYGMVNLHTYDKIAYDAYRDLNNDQFNVITDYFDEHLTNPYKDIALISRTGERFFYLHDYNIDRKSTRLNSTHVSISYAVFC